MTWLTLVVIAGAIGAGVLAYLRYGSRGGTLRDALAIIRAAFFVLVGIGLIAGGFVIAGALFVAVFVFLGIGAAVNVDKALRDRIAP